MAQRNIGGERLPKLQKTHERSIKIIRQTNSYIKKLSSNRKPNVDYHTKGVLSKKRGVKR